MPPLPGEGGGGGGGGGSEEEGSEEEESTEEPEFAQFREVSEVRFPAEVGPLGGQRVCKIKCVDGEWVGPLCALNEQGNFNVLTLIRFSARLTWLASTNTQLLGFVATNASTIRAEST